jgi:hypothetical protein
MRFSIFLGLLMALSIPAAAIAADAPAAESAKPAKPAKAEKICKTDKTQTVSRMPKRICKTAEEWANPHNHVDPSDLRRSHAR